MEPWKKNLYVLWGTQFLAMIGMNLAVPFLPFFIRQLGVTDQDALARWSGVVFAGPFLTAFIATPIWGYLGDKYGKKPMVVRAIIGLGLSQILVGFSQNVWQLFLFRILQGAISGFIASALALVSTSTPKEKTGYALGLMQSATAGGTVLGPALGGLLADHIGYREIFFIVAACCFLGGLLVIFLVKETFTPATDKKKITVLQNVQYMLTHRQLKVVAITIVFAQAAALMIEPLFALFIESFRTNTQYISTLTGIVFAISGTCMLLSAPWWGKRNDRLGIKKNLVLALVGTGTAYSLHLLVPNLIALGVVRAFLGLARGGILHALYTLTSQYAPAERRGGLISIASSLTIFGNMVGPLLGGMVASIAGITGVFYVNSLMFFVTGFVVWKYLSESIHQEHIEVQENVETL
jgi:MFS family permease